MSFPGAKDRGRLTCLYVSVSETFLMSSSAFAEGRLSSDLDLSPCDADKPRALISVSMRRQCFRIFALPKSRNLKLLSSSAPGDTGISLANLWKAAERPNFFTESLKVGFCLRALQKNLISARDVRYKTF